MYVGKFLLDQKGNSVSENGYLQIDFRPSLNGRSNCDLRIGNYELDKRAAYRRLLKGTPAD